MEKEEMLEQTNEEVAEVETEESFEEEPQDQVEEEIEESLEEQPKKIEMTQEEFDEKMQKRLDRQKRSLKREFDKEMSKLRRAKDLLGVSFDSDDIDEINTSMEAYLKENGYEVPETKISSLSEEEYEILGNAEADKIICLGEEEIIDELNRLKEFKYEQLSSKEKYVYKRLYEKLDENKKVDELKKNGIDTSILENKQFQQFEKKFSKDTSLLEIVEMYNKFNDTNPEPAKIGSLKSNSEKAVKEFYTEKEIANLTMDDLDKPGVFEAVRRSMTKSKK